MPVLHAFTDPKADGPDTTIVRPSDWNAGHVVSVDLATEVTGTLPLSHLVGLTTTQFASANISQWTNNSGYLTSNQSITYSGDVSGSGTTAVTLAIGAGKVTNSMLAGSITAAKLVQTDISIANTQVTGLGTMATQNASGLTGIGNILMSGNNAYMQTGTTLGDNWGVKAYNTSLHTYKGYIQAAAGNPSSMVIQAADGAGSLTIGSATISGGTIDTVDITASTLNSTPIGQSSAAAISATTLTASGNAVLSGVNTQPNQSSFLAYAGSNQSNCTGDGTVANITFGSESYDQAGDFASSTYTARKTGRHWLGCTLVLSGLTASHTSLIIQVVTTGGTYQLFACNGANLRNAGNNAIINGIIPVSMTLADTAFFQIAVSGGAKVVTILTSSFNTNFFGGIQC